MLLTAAILFMFAGAEFSKAVLFKVALAKDPDDTGAPVEVRGVYSHDAKIELRGRATDLLTPLWWNPAPS